MELPSFSRVKWAASARGCGPAFHSSICEASFRCSDLGFDYSVSPSKRKKQLSERIFERAESKLICPEIVIWYTLGTYMWFLYYFIVSLLIKQTNLFDCDKIFYMT